MFILSIVCVYRLKSLGRRRDDHCLSPLTLWVRTPLRRSVLDTTLCDKVCQRLAAGWWFSQGTSDSSTNKTYCHDITEILDNCRKPPAGLKKFS